jgi:hypothetical protein
VDSGSAVEISVSSDGLYVRTLMNDHNHGVAVKIGEEVKHVGVGSELCVAADQQGISDILRDRIPRRDEYWQKLPNGKILWTSNVSLAHLVGADAVLVTMYRQGGADKSIATKVHKMAAALFYSSGRRAPYRVIDPSKKISLAP